MERDGQVREWPELGKHGMQESKGEMLRPEKTLQLRRLAHLEQNSHSKTARGSPVCKTH